MTETLVALDARRRANLKNIADRDIYVVTKDERGTITLTPALVILEPEFADMNPEILRKLEHSIRNQHLAKRHDRKRSA